MITKDEQNKVLDYEWEQFRERFPLISSDNWFTRLHALFVRDNIPRAIWENGFLKGWLECHERYSNEREIR